jgi:hypothetical protein
LEFKKQILEKLQSLQNLKKNIEWFRITIYEIYRYNIIMISEAPRTKIILFFGREKFVISDAIAEWICYKNLYEYLRRRPEIYRLKNWNVIENLFRIKDNMEYDSIILKFKDRENDIIIKDKSDVDFFVFYKSPK